MTFGGLIRAVISYDTEVFLILTIVYLLSGKWRFCVSTTRRNYWMNTNETEVQACSFQDFGHEQTSLSNHHPGSPCRFNGRKHPFCVREFFPPFPSHKITDERPHYPSLARTYCRLGSILSGHARKHYAPYFLLLFSSMV